MAVDHASLSAAISHKEVLKAALHESEEQFFAEVTRLSGVSCSVECKGMILRPTPGLS